MIGPVMFVTSNEAKYRTARDHLATLGIRVERVGLELDEIQSTAVADVARHKAQQAFQTLARPVFVEDSGFEIEEFNGWPGPMAKHVIGAIGARGIARPGDLTQARRCRFVSTLAHIDERGTPWLFDDEGEWGEIAAEPSTTGTAASWSALWEVFVPAGHEDPLASLGEAARTALLARWRVSSVFARYGAWLLQT